MVVVVVAMSGSLKKRSQALGWKWAVVAPVAILLPLISFPAPKLIPEFRSFFREILATGLGAPRRVARP
ncbi:MAG TPA: hypothetical protein VG406_16365, partial [Isosphaeraceae bacterium]|nr:hypothetical protein [Isosphaeraceae bacterium]